MKTLMMITFISLLSGCGSEVEVDSYQTTMQCFRTHIGIECLGSGIQCNQPRGASRLTCRITVVTKDWIRQSVPVNPLNGEHHREIIKWN